MPNSETSSRSSTGRRGFLAASGAAALAGVATAQAQPAAPSTPATEIVAEFLRNTAEDKIQAAAQRLVAEDATYISLNFDNPDLKKILPWTGTAKGREAYTSTFGHLRHSHQQGPSCPGFSWKPQCDERARQGLC